MCVVYIYIYTYNCIHDIYIIVHVISAWKKPSINKQTLAAGKAGSRDGPTVMRAGTGGWRGQISV